jgi:hypothetical protein
MGLVLHSSVAVADGSAAGHCPVDKGLAAQPHHRDLLAQTPCQTDRLTYP